MNKIVTLLDRAVLRVTGPDAKSFLQNLVTNDIDRLDTEPAIMAALLSPQGKILYEFFIVTESGTYYLDTASGGADDLIKKFNLYKLRADVEIEDCRESHMVLWLNDDEGVIQGDAVLYADPRHKQMGWRAIVRQEGIGVFSEGFEPGQSTDYLAHRLMNAIPEGGHDYAFGDTFPHEAALDVLGAVDFKKGCYIGQEVVSRMEHRSNVRNRIVIVEGKGPLPLPGAEIRTTNSLIGVLGTSIGNVGLALVRLDRAGRAMRSGQIMKVDDQEVNLSRPPWAHYNFLEEEKPGEA